MSDFRIYFLRGLKVFPKLILGLAILILILVGTLHLPPVQHQMTRWIAGSLSDKIGSSVSIEEINFSINGTIEVRDLNVLDPESEEILDVGRITAKSNLIDLLFGDLIFDAVSVEALKGRLIRDRTGLNIQFIVDAFSDPTKEASQSENMLEIVFKSIRLETIDFEYTSVKDNLILNVQAGTILAENSTIFITPNKIKSNTIYLENTDLNISYLPNAFDYDSISAGNSESNKLLYQPDFGSGFDFEVNQLELRKNRIALHKKEQSLPLKFDPDHLVLDEIQLLLQNIQINSEALSADLNNLSLSLPNSQKFQFKSKLVSDKNQIQLSGFNAASRKSTLELEFLSRNSGKNLDMELALAGKLTPEDATYFLSDSLSLLIKDLGPVELSMEGSYRGDAVNIKNMVMKTGSSAFTMKGRLFQLSNPQELTWDQVTLQSNLGAEFKKAMAIGIKGYDVPSKMNIRLISSGSTSKFNLDAYLASSWGDLKTKGRILQRGNGFYVDLMLMTRELDIGKFIRQPQLGPVDGEIHTTGIAGENLNIVMDGTIHKLTILDQSVSEIDFQSKLLDQQSLNELQINDPDFHSRINATIDYAGPIRISANADFQDFNISQLMSFDSVLLVSGSTATEFQFADDSFIGSFNGKELVFYDHDFQVDLDSIYSDFIFSSDSSTLHFYSGNSRADMISNFDVREFQNIIPVIIDSYLYNGPTTVLKDREMDFSLSTAEPYLFRIFNIDIQQFSNLEVMGKFAEDRIKSHVKIGDFKGYGISLDTLYSESSLIPGDIKSNTIIQDLKYDSIRLGNLEVNMLSHGDTIDTHVLIVRDSIDLLVINVGLLQVGNGIDIYPKKLIALGKLYEIGSATPIYLGDKNIQFEDFKLNRGDMNLQAHGNKNDFNLRFENIDLRILNPLFDSDTSVINHGEIFGDIAFKLNEQIEISSRVDSLILYSSNPIKITANASTEGKEVPFGLKIESKSNRVEAEGKYLLDNSDLDANLIFSIKNLENLERLMTDYFEHISGSIQGETRFKGNFTNPDYKGFIKFADLEFTSRKPRSNFKIKESQITLDNSVLFEDFTFYDEEDNPLIINGQLNVQNYPDYDYNVDIKADNYTLLNNPYTEDYSLQGLLSIGAELNLVGNKKDSYLKAKIAVRDTTNLIYISSNENIELITNDGIVDFVDPYDTLTVRTDQNFYDSLIANLPDFNLDSRIVLEEGAVFKFVVDPQSGDFLEAAGAADLEFSYDRTGNVKLSGNYTVKKGIYRLSFYDLVKRSFDLQPGSSIDWTGEPTQGSLNIKATHTVRSSSIGLVGHEVGESEKASYKRSLPYEVAINIKGSIDNPEITFSLDLPREDKANFPVLQSKLERLKQPEFESELNKQVFGLLVLGGFIPETNVSDLNSNLIATTALTNSVNSILASQLNRFTDQYIKGVNIDIGIQSYSDFASPGGETRTSMDFRVSKSVMDDRLSFEVGGDFDISQDQSGANSGNSFRGDVAIIYDLTGSGDKLLKLFNNETYDIIYHEIRNTGVSLIFIREFNRDEPKKKK